MVTTRGPWNRVRKGAVYYTSGGVIVTMTNRQKKLRYP